MTTLDEREVLRQQIDAIISKIDNRGDLLFIQWLLKRITSNKPVPDSEELKKLRHAFVRVEKALRDKTAPLTPEDYKEDDEVHIEEVVIYEERLPGQQRRRVCKLSSYGRKIEKLMDALLKLQEA